MSELSNQTGMTRKHWRLAALIAAISSIVIGGLWLGSLAFPATRIAIRNGSPSPLTDIALDFAGSVETSAYLAPGEEITLSRRWFGEGSLLLTFKQNGEVRLLSFSYIAPGLEQSCEVVVLNNKVPAPACVYGDG